MTDRIEAIRERYSNAASEVVREDVAWLLAEVEHWKSHAEESGAGFAQVCRDSARMAARNTTLMLALVEIRDALNSHDMRYEYRNAERDAVASIRASLERHMGPDWPSAVALDAEESP